MRDSFANASKMVAFKLQVLIRRTFMREIASIPKKVVTRDNISSSDGIVSKCLFPKDTDIKQKITPVKVVGDGNCLSVGYVRL